MSMSCREFRELIDSYLAEELLVETNHEMIRHLEECAACRAELGGHRRLRAHVKSAFNGSADLDVRPEFLTTLAAQLRGSARPPAAGRRRLSSWWALAAGVALAAAIAGGVGVRRAVALRDAVRLTWSRPDSITQAVWQLARAAAGDHRDCALHFRLAEKPIPLEEAALRYDPAYHALRAAVRSQRADRGEVPIDIVEDHSCVFQGRRFAHIVLRYRGQLVSVLVTARDDRTAGSNPSASSPAIASLHGVEGFEAATFSAPRHVVFVVSALDAHDTLAVARTIADSVYQHLAGA
ncbi:MAG TPA: zf-HC2 domain-containing protein [Vicinamibacterales bacterium]|jgi:hypothetical protein|nr:zf-HC2 domain-containing protein [Vicinamibacterales bacterium]